MKDSAYKLRKVRTSEGKCVQGKGHAYNQGECMQVKESAYK